MACLKFEIIQNPPFFSIEEEAFLNLLRSADSLERSFHLRMRDWGVTSTQYNVLRILRGASPNPLTCSAIGERMITAVPDITRLLARLKSMNLIEQERDDQDRRVVWTRISEAGIEKLRAMDPIIQQFPRELFSHMRKEEVEQLIHLLEKARGPLATSDPRQ